MQQISNSGILNIVILKSETTISSAALNDATLKSATSSCVTRIRRVEH